MKKTKFITREEALNNGNDGHNQEIKGKLIGLHVYSNVNTMVEYILQKSYEDSEAPFSIYDIENYYTYSDIEYQQKGKTFYFSGTASEKESLINELENQDNVNDDELKECSAAIEIFENAEDTPQDVYEWWLVSDYFYNKLKQRGHPVINTGANCIWGRCTTGQAILLDHVITCIAADMEILQGQPNEWKIK